MTNEQKDGIGRIIIPPIYHDRISCLIDRHSFGCLGLSIGKKEFENDQIITAYAYYLHETFDFSLMIIADTLKRHNIMAIEGVSETEALRRASIAGNNLFRFIEKKTRRLYNVKVARWDDFMQEVPCRKDLLSLQQGYKESISFRRDCDDCVRLFLENPSNLAKINMHSTLEKAVSIAKDYLLEELAVMSALPQLFGGSHCVEIYPGKLEVQHRLYSGHYRAVLKEDSPSLSLFSGRLSQGCTVPVEAYYESPNKEV